MDLRYCWKNCCFNNTQKSNHTFVYFQGYLAYTATIFIFRIGFPKKLPVFISFSFEIKNHTNKGNPIVVSCKFLEFLRFFWGQFWFHELIRRRAYMERKSFIQHSICNTQNKTNPFFNSYFFQSAIYPGHVHFHFNSALLSPHDSAF